MSKPLFPSTSHRAPETEGRYSYRTYELRRQAKLSFFFRKVRFFYISFCGLFLAAAYPYILYSLSLAAALVGLAALYSILRYYTRRSHSSRWQEALWYDLMDYFLIGGVICLTGGPRSFFIVAFAIPIVAATVRFNIKAGLCGLGLAAAITGLSALAPELHGSLPLPFGLLFGLGTMAFAAWAISGLIEDELKINRELYNYSVTDPLTGLYHFGYGRERINEEIKRCRREGSIFSIVFLDMDRFKKVNDRYGHQTGDAVVRHVSAVMQSALREGDMLSRYGGDEFVALLPGASLEDAESTLERLLQAVNNRPYSMNGVPILMGFSGGAAEYPGEGQSLEQLLHVADQKMYLEKKRLNANSAQN